MNIIICGAGRVGFSISKQLSAQGHSITVIDQSSEFIEKINNTQDVKGVVGRATFPSVLEKAGAEDADMIIAVTQNDETNMVICQVAYSIFKISKKIARIRGQEFLGKKWGKLFGESNLPIDVIISPELEVAKSLQRKLDAPGALDSVPFVNGKIKVLEIGPGWGFWSMYASKNNMQDDEINFEKSIQEFKSYLKVLPDDFFVDEIIYESMITLGLITICLLV